MTPACIAIMLGAIVVAACMGFTVASIIAAVPRNEDGGRHGDH